MEVPVSFHDGHVVTIVRDVLEFTGWVDVASVTAVQRLEFESVVKLAGFRCQRALDGERRLVEQRLGVPVVKEPAKELVIVWRAGARGDPGLYQVGKLDA